MLVAVVPDGPAAASPGASFAAPTAAAAATRGEGRSTRRNAWAIGVMADTMVRHFLSYMGGNGYNNEAAGGDGGEPLPLDATRDEIRSTDSDAPAMGGLADMMACSLRRLYSSGDTLVDYFRRLRRYTGGNGYDDEGVAFAMGSFMDTVVGYARRLCYYSGHDEDGHVVVAKDMDGGDDPLLVDAARRWALGGMADMLAHMLVHHFERYMLDGYHHQDGEESAKLVDGDVEPLPLDATRGGGESLSAGGFVEMVVDQFRHLRRYIVVGSSDDDDDDGDAGDGDSGESLPLPLDESRLPVSAARYVWL